MTARLESAIAELVAAIRAEAALVTPDLPDRLLSIDEAAKALGIGRSMTYELIGRGDLRSLKIGRRRVVASSAIADYAGRAP